MGLFNHGIAWRRLPVVLLAMLVTVGFGCDLLVQSPYRKALPDTASDIREHRSGVVGFTYLLRAKITEEEFEAYVKQLGLELKSGGEYQSGASTEPGERNEDDPGWWRLNWSAERVYGIRRDGDLISVKWEYGFVYLTVIHL